MAAIRCTDHSVVCQVSLVAPIPNTIAYNNHKKLDVHCGRHYQCLDDHV